jgi:hypothetical protein
MTGVNGCWWIHLMVGVGLLGLGVGRNGGRLFR